MSKRHSAVGLSLLALFAVLAPAQAQQGPLRVRVTPSAETMRLRAIAESLFTEAERTRTESDAARHERLIATRFDTLVGFGATLRVPHEDAAMVLAAIDTAASALAALHGMDQSTALAGLTSTLVPSTLWSDSPFLSRFSVGGWSSGETAWPIVQARREIRIWSVEGVREHIYEKVNSMREAAVDAAMREWTGDMVRVWPGDSTMWSTAYRAMAVASSRPTRRCATGQGPCDVILGLTPPTDPWHDWYDPSDVRLRVLAPRAVDPDPPLHQQCESGKAPACEQYARQFTGVPVLPGPPIARRMLFVLALRQGGPLAHQRLMADTTAPIGMRLAATAGLPLPALVSAFTDSLRRYREPSPMVRGETAWSVSLAAALCLVVTLRRRRESTH